MSTAAALLTDLERQGFTLTAEGAGIRVRPLSALLPATRAAVKEYKPELLVLLAARDQVTASWDASRAAAELATIGARLDAETASAVPMPSRQGVVDAYRAAAAKLAARHDPVLFQVREAIDEAFGQWVKASGCTIGSTGASVSGGTTASMMGSVSGNMIGAK